VERATRVGRKARYVLRPSEQAWRATNPETAPTADRCGISRALREVHNMGHNNAAEAVHARAVQDRVESAEVAASGRPRRKQWLANGESRRHMILCPRECCVRHGEKR